MNEADTFRRVAISRRTSPWSTRILRSSFPNSVIMFPLLYSRIISFF
nr:MAG TPA: hypothetical protein [Caudoviricetes sp.]